MANLLPYCRVPIMGIEGARDPWMHGLDKLEVRGARGGTVVQGTTAHGARIDPSTHGGTSMDRWINIDPGVKMDH